MSIPLQARFVDLVNLIIAKGSNFVLTMLLFAIVARGMDTHAFGEFGYWWSMALMMGGVLLGGLASAMVRGVAMHGSLHYLLAPMRHAAFALLALAAVFVTLMMAFPDQISLVMLLGVLVLFGIAVQTQTVVLTLLRALEATRVNALASAGIVVVVPLVLMALLGDIRAMISLFSALAVAFVIGTVVALVIGRGQLGHLFIHDGRTRPGLAGFFTNASAFTAVNVFTYVIVNLDFTLFRQIGSPDDFAVIATAKVFFERFVLPALLVFGGAVSMRVLRHPHAGGSSVARLQLRTSPAFFGGMLVAIMLLAALYEGFAKLIRGDTQTIGLVWAACAAAGYLVFTINSILFDVLVVQRNLKVVIVRVTSFLVLGGAVQVLAISRFGVPGWAFGWLFFNLMVLFVLARDGLDTGPRLQSERSCRAQSKEML